MSMQFDLTDLRLFVACVEGGSITVGARRVHLALPSASERIRSLEAHLGVRLLERERRGVRPTAAGDSLLHHARLVLEQVERLRGELGEHTAGLRGRVRLLANSVASSEYLPDLLGAYLADHPRIDIELIEQPSMRIVPAIEQGLADLGIVADSTDPGTLQSFRLRGDRLAALCRADHVLANRSEVAFETLLDWPMVGLAGDSALQLHLADQAARLRKPMLMRLGVRSFEGVRTLVGRGVGVAVVPDSLVSTWSQTPASPGEQVAADVQPLRALALTDAWADRHLLLCMRRRDDLPLHVAHLVERLVATSAA